MADESSAITLHTALDSLRSGPPGNQAARCNSERTYGLGHMTCGPSKTARTPSKSVLGPFLASPRPLGLTDSLAVQSR